MLISHHKNLKRSKNVFTAAGIFVIALGLTAITGWYLNIGSFTSVFPNYVTMKFNTALCFIVTGIAFLLLINHRGVLLRSVFRLFAVFLGVFAITSFSQDVFHWSAGIDQFFVTDYTSIRQNLPFPGRMSPSTSLCFSLMAGCFLGIDSQKLRFRKLAQYGLHFITLIAFVAIIGYLLKVPYTLKFNFFSSMAINTAMGFLLISATASAIHYHLGFTGFFTRKKIGNIVARKLFPRMILILVATGYVSIELQRKGYVSAEFGIVLSTITFLLIGLFLIKDTLTEMNRLDLKRTLAENATKKLNKNLENMVLQRTRDLKHSNDRFIKIFNSNPIGIAISKLDTGEYVQVNSALTEILGYSFDEIIGHRSSDLLIISDDYRTRMVSILTGQGFIRNEDVILQDKHNEFRHCILSAELLETEDQQFMMSFIYDITSRKITENKLQDAKKDLEVLTDKLTNQNKQLLSFAHIISHNLRSPVSNLNLLVHFYKESTTQEDKDELWGNFETVIGHLNITLDDLLETLKIQEDIAKEREELSFEKIFIASTDILVGQIKESGAIIKTDFSNAPHIVYPKIYLESIMLNLVSNAIKYKSPKRTPEIIITTDSINGETILTVQDNGLGIDLARHQKNLFGMRKTFHRHAEAKGLGLFITKTQIEAMGGKISAESTVDKGTTFKIIFNKQQHD